mmetsp:Transcript_90988/g.254151  ORF Transcript_90988/g.254151 Transcript_90988/m.254151 type:complete len:404 (-) Transcript_90988:88-1299(-)
MSVRLGPRALRAARSTQCHGSTWALIARGWRESRVASGRHARIRRNTSNVSENLSNRAEPRWGPWSAIDSPESGTPTLAPKLSTKCTKVSSLLHAGSHSPRKHARGSDCPEHVVRDRLADPQDEPLVQARARQLPTGRQLHLAKQAPVELLEVRQMGGVQLIVSAVLLALRLRHHVTEQLQIQLEVHQRRVAQVVVVAVLLVLGLWHLRTRQLSVWLRRGKGALAKDFAVALEFHEHRVALLAHGLVAEAIQRHVAVLLQAAQEGLEIEPWVPFAGGCGRLCASPRLQLLAVDVGLRFGGRLLLAGPLARGLVSLRVEPPAHRVVHGRELRAAVRGRRDRNGLSGIHQLRGLAVAPMEAKVRASVAVSPPQRNQCACKQAHLGASRRRNVVGVDEGDRHSGRE